MGLVATTSLHNSPVFHQCPVDHVLFLPSRTLAASWILVATEVEAESETHKYDSVLLIFDSRYVQLFSLKILSHE